MYDSSMQGYADESSAQQLDSRQRTIKYLREELALDAVFALAIADMAGEINWSDGRQQAPIKRKLLKKIDEKPAQQALKRIREYYQHSV